MRPLDHKISHKLAHKGADISDMRPYLQENLELELLMAPAQGLEIQCKNNRYYFKTRNQEIDDATFCIVDIETNGSKPDRHQIIELGAVKIRGGEIIDQYESLVMCSEISSHITELTGITVEMTKEAPTLQRVLNEFKSFIGCDVFVAHAVKFDFGFISSMFEHQGMQPMLNRHLCSIDLAERTFSSFRYGLNYLNDSLALYHSATHHRALSDALVTAELFKKSLKLLPQEVQCVEELIHFSKNSKRLKRPKLDPMKKGIKEG